METVKIIAGILALLLLLYLLRAGIDGGPDLPKTPLLDCEIWDQQKQELKGCD